MKTVLLCLVGSLLAGSAIAQKTYYCEMTQSAVMDGKPTGSSLAKVWMKSPTVFRMEKIAKGQKIIIIANGSNIWMVNMARKEALKSSQPPAVLAQLNRVGRVMGADLNGFVKSGAKKVGQENIDGIKCDLYRRKETNGGVLSLWVMPGADQLTRRQLVTGNIQAPLAPGKPATTHALRMMTDFNRWQIGKPMAASLFTAPQGVKIVTQPTGMQGMRPGQR